MNIFCEKNLRTRLETEGMQSTEFKFGKDSVISVKDNKEIFLRSLVKCLADWKIYAISTYVDEQPDQISFRILVPGKYMEVLVSFHFKQ
jgi:hypothetical protein